MPAYNLKISNDYCTLIPELYLKMKKCIFDRDKKSGNYPPTRPHPQ
jgi:hypothetical protein